MKLKILILSCAAILFFVFGLNAQENVKIESSVNNGTKMGNMKLLANAPKEIFINQFCVWYRTARQDEGNLIRWRMELDLTESTALEITNEGFLYLKSQLESKGYTVHAYDRDVIESTKTFIKFKKKDSSADVTNGTFYSHRADNPNDYRIGTWAEGVNTTYLGAAAAAGHYGMLAHELGGKEGKLSLSILSVIDFMEWDIAGKENDYEKTETMEAIPTLRLYDEPIFGQTYFAFHNSSKSGSKLYGGNEYIYSNNNWIGSKKEQDEDVHTWVIDTENYKAACLSLVKTYIDELVDRIEHK